LIESLVFINYAFNDPARRMISGQLMLIYCERKTLLSSWLILADKIKRTG
jgi:hypothetical protein